MVNGAINTWLEDNCLFDLFPYFQGREIDAPLLFPCTIMPSIASLREVKPTRNSARDGARIPNQALRGTLVGVFESSKTPRILILRRPARIVNRRSTRL